MVLLLNNQKKAISPIIAVILLLLMTVAAAGAAFFWIQSTQRQVQSGISEQTEEVQRNVAVDLRVLSAEYSTSTNLLQVLIVNGGGVNVATPGDTSQITIKYLNGSVVCSTNLTGLTSAPTFTNGTNLPSSVTPSGTANLTMDLNAGACVSRISETSLLQYTFQIDLTGRASLSGSFNIP